MRAVLVAMAVAGLASAAKPPSPGRPPRFFGLEAVGERVVYVCDRSASMSEPAGVPLASAKRELLESIEGLGSNRQFHLIFYNERQSVFEPAGGRGRPMFADETTLREVRRFVEGTSAAGGTRHEQAILTALRLAPDVIFLLTDADATHDLTGTDLDRLAGRLGRARVMIVQFGGADDRRSPRLARLAELSGGVYRVMTPTAAD
ncbi:MAG: hypothetical protein FJ284_09875 [Planctomycetes bacterium]|nr:hypothetical protein [Planctomycetota bacterium]MBM4057324.1 hypothetical protein [Planctomycetota bacterium]